MTRWLALLLLAGCALSRAPTPAPAARPTTADDALDAHLQALRLGLGQEGLQQGADGLLERGFLPPSGRAAFPVRVAAGHCSMFVALATASMVDLDAALYTADGAALVEDDSTGSRPTLTFCASPTRSIDAYLTLHAYQGAGAYLAAQFTRAARPDDDLRMVGAERDVSALSELAQTLHDRGFEDAGPRVSLPLVAAQPVRMAVQVRAGECYTLAVEGGEGLSDLGLRLVDASGGELALGLSERQSGRARLAALQYCADRSAELALEVVAGRGQGVAKVARFRVSQALVGGARALWLGEPSPSERAWQALKSNEAVASKSSAGGAAPKSELATRSAGPNDAHHSKAARERVSTSAPTSPAERIPLRQGQLIELAPRRPSASCEHWRLDLEPGLSRATLRVEDGRGELLGEVDSDHMHACLALCAPGALRRPSVVGRTGFGAVQLRVEPLQGPDDAACTSSGRR